jgi:hypothetical protein
VAGPSGALGVAGVSSSTGSLFHSRNELHSVQNVSSGLLIVPHFVQRIIDPYPRRSRWMWQRW